MKRRAAILALLAGLELAGCSSSQDFSATRIAAEALFSVLNPEPPENFPEPTRAQLDADGRPLLRAYLASRDADALLFQVGSNGPVATWATVDARTFSLRDGLLVQTRGLGGDLMSSRLPPAAAIRRGQGSVTRLHSYLGPNDQTVLVEFACSLSDRGAERVTVAQLTYATRRVAEACAGPGLVFENLYWIEADGTIRQSEQWIGPALGPVAFFDLRR